MNLRAQLPAQNARFLHLIRDEKFIDDAMTLFEQAGPGTHDLLCIEGRTKFRHVRHRVARSIALRKAIGSDFLGILPEYNAVFIHYLSPAARCVVHLAPAGVRFVWIGWGSDYYHLISERQDLFLPSTSALTAVLERKSLGETAGRRARRLARLIMHPLEGISEAAASVRRDRLCRIIGQGAHGEDIVLGRIQYFAPVLADEYQRIVARNPAFLPAHARWNYKVNGFIDSLAHPPAPLGPNVLVGNSATPENNHLDLFEQVRDALGPGQRIICPLSYGNAKYGRHVTEVGAKMFGNRFVGVTEFLPQQEYMDLVASCGTVVMNHVRQQGMGNVLTALALGAKVFLRRENPMFDFFLREKVPVYPIDMLRTHLLEGAPPPQLEAVEETRERLGRLYGSPALLDMTRRLIRAACSTQPASPQ